MVLVIFSILKVLAIVLAILIFSYSAQGQTIAQRANPLDTTLEQYVNNSPGSNIGNSRVITKIRDSSYHKISTLRFWIPYLDSTRKDGRTRTFLWTDSIGNLNKSVVDSLLTSAVIVSTLGYTPANAGTAGTVSGVAMTVPAAFSVAGSPVTTTGTLAISAAGSSAQFVKGDGTLGTTATSLPPSGSAGGDLTGTYPNPTLTTSGIGAGKYIVATFNTKGVATSGNNPAIDTLSASRSFNTSYQTSSTSWTDIRPCASISCALSLSGGQAGIVFLEYSSDNSNWTQAGQITASNTGTLTVGLNTTQISGGVLSMMLPPSYWWRLRTSNTTGTPTYTMQIGSKITY